MGVIKGDTRSLEYGSYGIYLAPKRFLYRYFRALDTGVCLVMGGQPRRLYEVGVSQNYMYHSGFLINSLRVSIGVTFFMETTESRHEIWFVAVIDDGTEETRS